MSLAKQKKSMRTKTEGKSIFEKNAVQRLKAEQIREMIESPVYCNCDNNRWLDFAELKEYIVTHQARSCSDCGVRFKHVILIEKTQTVGEIICSFRGLVLLLTSLSQYSILYYISFLSFVDVHLSGGLATPLPDRHLLMAMTVLVLLVSINMNIRGLYNWAMAEMQANAEAKLIVDVIPDLQDSALVKAKKNNLRVSLTVHRNHSK